VVVADPSADARRLAAERWREIDGHDRHELELVASTDALPQSIDVGIVATTSGPRLEALRGLLRERVVRHVVMEKFLFPSVAEYDEAEALLSAARAEGWVNTPRRLMGGWRRVAEIIGEERPIELRVTTTSRNAVGTTAVHFLDALAYLSGQRVFVADGRRLVRAPEASRRPGYIEYTGILTARAASGDRLSYEAVATGDVALVVHIVTPIMQIVIEESRSTMRWCAAPDDGVWHEEEFEMALQSEMSGDVVHALATRSVSDLPRFAESRELHTALLEAFAATEQAATGQRPDRVLVT
jgi:predicted dehydrogenase